MLLSHRIATALTLSLLSGILFVRSATAQTAAIGFTSGAYAVEDNAADTGATSYVLGFEFTANSPSEVTALGYFDDSSFDSSQPFNTVALSPTPSGTYTYSQSHQVALYQVIPANGPTPESGLLLTQTIITSASSKNGDFRFADITPITLISGNTYVLAGVSGANDPYIFNIADDGQVGSVGLTVNPAIAYVQDRSGIGSLLAFPANTDSGSEPGFFGPNLLFSVASSVPEPSTLTVLGLGGVLLGMLIVRIRKRAI